MTRMVVMDEFHLTVTAPRGLTDAEYDAVVRTLAEPRFRADLRRAVRAVLGRYPALGKARVAVTV